MLLQKTQQLTRMDQQRVHQDHAVHLVLLLLRRRHAPLHAHHACTLRFILNNLTPKIPTQM